VAAWLVAQVVTQIFPVFEVSPWALRSMIVLLITGFPIALILAWAFDITPEGIKRTDDIDLAKVQARRAEAIPLERMSEKSLCEILRINGRITAVASRSVKL